jgi:hypothetical protein
MWHAARKGGGDSHTGAEEGSLIWGRGGAWAAELAIGWAAWVGPKRILTLSNYLKIFKRASINLIKRWTYCT